jgi:hypothetical protein
VTVRSLAEAAAFLLELAALAGFAVWGAGVGGIALAVLLPLAVAVGWGVWLAPRARRPLRPRLRLGIRTAVLLLGTLAFGGWLGLALAAAVLLDTLALALLA